MRKQFSTISTPQLNRHRHRIPKQNCLDRTTSIQWFFVVKLLLFLCGWFSSFATGFAIIHHFRSHSLSSLHCYLDSLTVKELRQLVKDSVQERGILSKLKKKQDLIDFLGKAPPTSSQVPNAVPIPNESIPNHELTSPLDYATTVNGDGNDTDSQQSQLANPVESDLEKPFGVLLSSKSFDLRKTPLGMPPAEIVTGPSLLASGTIVPLSPREMAAEQVLARYPPLRDLPTPASFSPADDVRQLFHPIFTPMAGTTSDMDLIFVGTASCTPGVTRGVSCTALRLNWRRRSYLWNSQSNRLDNVDGFQGGTWLFDVGECTQLQIQRTPNIKPSKITKIFLTHAHGDHSFGLPGLLCLMGQDRDRDSPPVDIYGPEGLRMWLRITIRYSVSRIVPPYRVHEIMDVPMAPEWEFAPRSRRYFYRGNKPQEGGDNRWTKKGLAGEDAVGWVTLANSLDLEPSPLYGEIDGGRDIYPNYDHPMCSNGAPVWEVDDEEDVQVYAAPMSHGIPCLGYVVEERPRPGRLRNELVEPVVRRNMDALREAGFQIPMKVMAVIKNLPPGRAFNFPDGTVLTHEEAVEPKRQGRKIVICGDTCDSRAMEKLAKHADVVVHEATNCFLQGIDKDTDLRSVTKEAIFHGHSTPHIAGLFARKVQARRLILNHFSARYKGDPSVDSLSIMMRIEKIAMKASGLNMTQVAAAWDLMAIPIPSL